VIKDSFIYPVITPEFCKGRSPVKILESVLKGGVRIVQLRDKTDPERYAADFRKITSKHNALLIVNDSVNIALKYKADGIHLGQKDMPVKEARRLAPDLIIGVSCHDLGEALKAQDDGASYVNIGPIFETKTKSMPPIGVETIKKIAPHLKIPFTVMGGINKGNIAEVINAGARRIAMVTAITESSNVEETVKEFINMLK
jgi:thiamine-phosphate pyrophosphorylase